MKLTASTVAIVPSPPGANLIIINPTKNDIVTNTAMGHPHRFTSKLLKKYTPNHKGDNANDNATSARQYDPSHGIDTVSFRANVMGYSHTNKNFSKLELSSS